MLFVLLQEKNNEGLGDLKRAVGQTEKLKTLIKTFENYFVNEKFFVLSSDFANLANINCHMSDSLMSSRCASGQSSSELATYLVSLLDTLKLSSTADSLRQQAHLNRRPNIPQDIRKIIQSHPEDLLTRKKLIKDYFETLLRKLIKSSNIDQALHIFQNYIPRYVDDLQPFSMLFTQTLNRQTQEIDLIMRKMLAQTTMLPQRRVGDIQGQEPIWFIQVLEEAILVVDEKSNARVIKETVVVCEKEKLHQAPILSLAVNEKGRFATGSQDHQVRVWNFKLQQLYELTRHCSPVSAICFSQTHMASFDDSGTIFVVTAAVDHAVAKKNSLPYFKLKNIAFVDVKYFQCKNVMIGVGNPQQKGRLDIIDLQRRKFTTKLLFSQQQIYSLQLSSSSKLIFLNLNTQIVHCYTYNTPKLQLLFKVSGYLQQDNLMRMSLGGNNNDVLAVTSEEGCVCLFGVRKKGLLGKIRGRNGRSVNCVRWMGERIVFGGDQGVVQQWGCQESAWSKALMNPSNDEKMILNSPKSKQTNDEKDKCSATCSSTPSVGKKFRRRRRN